MEKQTGSSFWNCFDTILQDMSADDNCISAELDQFLLEPLISYQGDPASWWKMNMHAAQVSSVVTTRTEIPGMPPPTSVPLDRLFTLQYS